MGSVRALLPANEAQRLQALRSLRLLDTPAEAAFDRITRLAALHFGVPIVLLSLVDADRQWFKSSVGMGVSQTGRDESFCGHAILGSAPLVVQDTLEDPRFATNPLVMGDPCIRFYAGAPVTSPEGDALGTICIIDRRPRRLDEAGRAFLMEIAQLVNDVIAQRRRAFDLTVLEGRERQALEQFRLFFEHAPLPMYRLNIDGLVLAWNPAAERILGFSSAEVLGTFHPLVPADRRGEFDELRAQLLTHPEPVIGLRRIRQRKGGEPITVNLSITPLQDAAGSVIEFLGVVQDVTEQEMANRRLAAAESETIRLQAEMLRVEQERARIDPLTGLGNRRACDEAFAREASRADRASRPLSLVIFDLDHFKKLNDQAGHLAGDETLRLFAAALRDGIRAADQAIRWGGEEFVLLLPEATESAAGFIADRIRRSFAARSEAAGLPATVSGGVAQRLPGEDLEALVARADIRLYQAKSSGRNTIA